MRFGNGIPLKDQCPLLRRFAKERRMRCDVLKVGCDRGVFGEHGAIVGLEDRDGGLRVDVEEGRAKVLARAQIDVLGFDVDPFFCDCNARPARAGRCDAIKKDHSLPTFSAKAFLKASCFSGDASVW